ncbi:MAG: FKBP-type peptidyl-prolyl cis-trans isomerase, partial [Pseudomonadota bacterium]|nr:FKBP-type peptidyl-prolyl cis-trans isomerase [Pseudomonadota bacterium]
MNDLIARTSDVAVGPGTRIRLHFSILLADGSEVDSTRGAEPAVFTFGDGSLLPGFENAIAGLREGESAQFEIAARDGFGDCKEVNIQELPIASFAAVGELEP